MAFIIACVSSTLTGGRISIYRLRKRGNLESAGELAFPFLVLGLAVLVYGLYGFDGVLLRDYSIYLYSGQRMAEGIPPYVSIFDHKGPLSPMIAGLGVMLSGLFNWDDIYTDDTLAWELQPSGQREHVPGDGKLDTHVRLQEIARTRARRLG